MMTNPLTKGIPSKVFHKHITHMGVLLFAKSLV